MTGASRDSFVPGGAAIRRILLAVAVWLSGPGGAPAAQSPAPGGSFRDCDECPEMVVVPTGTFVIGSPTGERDRAAHEGPQRTVSIAATFAAGKYEVTRAQFAAFARDTGLRPAGTCVVFDAATAAFRQQVAPPRGSWPGYPQDDDHPVACVEWAEAKAYADWLTRKTGRRYRLLSEAEWEYAARATSRTSRPWGDDPALACRHANLADATFVREVPRSTGGGWYPGWHACRDAYRFTAPVGRFEPNRFGLHDMIGNLWEWVEDCWNDLHGAAAADAGPRLAGDCGARVYRGGAWRSYPVFGRSAQRSRGVTGLRHALIGFRVARSLEQPPR